MKRLLLFLLITCSLPAMAQPSDFVLLRKNNRTVKSFFPGSKLLFTSTSGRYMETFVAAVKNDTLYLKEFIIRQIPTQLGVYILDTSYYPAQVHYNQIKSIGKEGRRFDLAGSGGALMGGGLLLAVGSGVVYLADNKKFSPELLGAAAGLFGVGYLLAKQGGKGMVIGKKYELLYVKATEIKRE